MPETPNGKFYVSAGWDDVPHLSEKTKKELEASTPPHLRAARMRGEPSLGSGAIYPVPVEEIRINPIPIPDYWPRGYGFDPGWNRTAAAWGAWDRDNDVIYIIGEHYMGQREPSVHADAIRARGAWQPGIADYAGRGIEGERVIEVYRKLGLNLINADKSVEAGIYEVWQRLSSGRLKVFSTCQHWFEEYRYYIRDEKGQIQKVNDHLMDATRYLCMMPGKMIVRPRENNTPPPPTFRPLDARMGY